MKKIILLITLFFLIVTSFSQTKTSTTFAKDYFLKRSKNQKTVAWVMAGGGVAMTAIGIAIEKNIEPTLSDPFGLDRNTAPVILVLAGIGTTLGSIPFFMSSAKNKRRAATVSFGPKRNFILQQNTLVYRFQPALSLKVEL